MNVLSLFDGISCARIALENLGVAVEEYFSSEVDKNCVDLSQLRFPNNIHLGDVRNISKKRLPKIDLVIGGSPCQDISNAFKGDGLAGSRSSLFFEYVRILKELKPSYFLLENVRSAHQALMDNEIGVKGIELNSAKFSAQSRPRCYWTNLQIVDEPKAPSCAVISDILEKNPEEYYFLDSKVSEGTIPELLSESKVRSNKIVRLGMIDRELLRDNERQRRVYSIYGKSPTLLARSDSPKIIMDGRIRKLTPLECERLQSIPDNFTEGFSRTNRYKMVGNGFTVSVISHILEPLRTKN